MSEEQDNQNGNYINTQGYADNASIIQLRLDTEKELFKFEYNLRGLKIEYVANERGEPTPITTQIGDPLANKIGCQNLISWLNSRFNAMVVQANIDKEHYDNFVGMSRIELSKCIFINQKAWGIRDEYIGKICDDAIAMIGLFITRPIDNKERESYSTRGEISNSQVIRQPMGMRLPFVNN